MLIFVCCERGCLLLSADHIATKIPRAGQAITFLVSWQLPVIGRMPNCYWGKKDSYSYPLRKVLPRKQALNLHLRITFPSVAE